MPTVTLSFNVTTENFTETSKITLQATLKESNSEKIDDVEIMCDLNGTNTITFEDIENGEYVLSLEMAGKTDDDTDFVNGSVIKSAEITIDNFKFDDFDITDIVTNQSYYTHNFNGNGEEVTELFSKTLGCNGKVEFVYNTPMYMWLLENMG